MGSSGQNYFTEQLVSNVFQDRNLISFGSPEGQLEGFTVDSLLKVGVNLSASGILSSSAFESVVSSCL
jgi:hypothetical protein